jgi:putative mRNA 3-end processing factor
VTREVKIEWASGVMVTTKETSLVLDPMRRGGFDRKTHRFISHAHADHTQCFSTIGPKYATKPTRIIYEGLHKKPIVDFKELKMKHPVKLDDVEVTPINAGHMLGSIQFRIATPHGTLLYTGDLNCIDTLTTSRAENVECDVLLIEATFGKPYYVFPDREATYAKIVDWATQRARDGYVPTFHVYAAGKAQEIVRLFNTYTRLPVVVSPLVSAANEAYNCEGVRLSYETSELSNKEGHSRQTPYVYVTTPSDSILPEKSEKAVATGWALEYARNRFPSFPLSSHADFMQLVEFVKATKAKTVYVFTGFAGVFASYLQKKLEINARPLPSVTQKKLIEFKHWKTTCSRLNCTCYLTTR